MWGVLALRRPFKTPRVLALQMDLDRWHSNGVSCFGHGELALGAIILHHENQLR